jgi:hypothetical protein
MKFKFLLFSMMLLFVLACNDKSKSAVEASIVKTEMKDTTNSLKGTWELKGFYNYKNNMVVDSFSNNTISRQVKIYTDSKVMWCKLIKTDSIEFFGSGSYDYDDGSLTETLEFGSAFMNDVIKGQQDFNFALELEANRFQQIELDEDGNKIYSENYERVE